MTSETRSLRMTDGIDLFVRSYQRPDPRYDVLIVHGVAEHSGRWESVASTFVDHGANVTTFDLRGHGRSGGPRMDVESIDRFREDISEVASAMVEPSGRQWVLYGHSLGGLLVTGYLLEDYAPAPNLAVLSAPALDDGLSPILKSIAKGLGGVLGNVRVDSGLKGEWLSRDPAVAEAYFADDLITTKGTLRLGKATFADMERQRAAVGTLTTPTYVFHGAEDVLVPTAASAVTATSPAVTRVVLPGLRHEAHNESEAAMVLGGVTDWIDRRLA